MKWKPEEFSKKLKQAVDAYDKGKATILCEELIAHLRSRTEPYPEPCAKKDLQALRNKRYFDLMARMADAYLRAGLATPQILRQYAQALLDQKQVSAALAILREIEGRGNASGSEYAEARGLTGRAYKQIYTDAGDSRVPENRNALLRAIDAYHSVYESDPNTHVWHGVNAASLLLRAKADGVDAGTRPAPETVARRVLDTVSSRDLAKTANMWDLATGAEACVVLGDFQQAATLLKRYALHEGTDAFELASTLRQFEEVLQLDRDEPDEACLLDLLRGELLRHGGGCIEGTTDDWRRLSVTADSRLAGLEKLLGPDKYLPHEWLLKAFRRARNVGRIWRGGFGIATGFLVSGDILSKKWARKQVFVSNYHVVNTKGNAGGHRLDQLEVTFDVHPNRPRRTIARILWESSLEELDTTCMLLNAPIPDPDDIATATKMPASDGKDRVYVIGHPQGGELSYSIHDTHVLALDAKRIRYRSPTEPGSSGSPLFNDKWELLGIHHSGALSMPPLNAHDNGGKPYPANEGILLPAIRHGIVSCSGQRLRRRQ